MATNTKFDRDEDPWTLGSIDTNPVATVANISVTANGTVVSLAIPAGKQADRIVVRENQAAGEMILGFEVDTQSGESDGTAAAAAAGTWQREVAASGQSIGNRFIGFFAGNVTSAVRLNVTRVNGPTSLLEVSAYSCSRTPAPSGCSYLKDFAYKLVGSITISTTADATAAHCCGLCRATTKCAVFVLSPKGVCTLMSANQGGAASASWISGTVSR
jgi:hypothetical protein